MDNQEIDYYEIEEIVINYKSEDAVKLLVSLLKTNKNDLEILFEKAMIYYYIDSDLNKALSELNNLLRINPNYIEALLLKGEILAGIHKYNEAIKTLNSIHPKVLPYGYKKLIEYIIEFSHRRTDYYSVFDLVSYFEYVYIEVHMFKKINERSLDYLEYSVFENGLIWQYLYTKSNRSLKESIPIISGARLSDEESNFKSNVRDVEKCAICGRKLKDNQKNICKSCMKKQYASRIVKKLVSVVQPEISFKKKDLKSLNLDDIQIQDYIWTLQEFDLIDVDNNKLRLKDKDTLNNFRIESKMEPIDFDSINKENSLNKTCKICGKSLPISQFYKSPDGYEDICKNCKKLTATARYLEEIINYVGFGNEFDENDLNEYIANKNQIMGMIWSLQDNDLLIGNEDQKYILVERSKCLNFLDRYNPNYEYDEKNIKSKSKVKSNTKSKVKSGLEKTNALTESDRINSVVKSKNKNKKDSSDSNERKQMEFVLKLLRQGKSRSEVAEFTEINESTITSWYNQGKDKFNENTVYFYNEVQKIMDKTEKKSSRANKTQKSKSKTKSEDEKIKAKNLKVQIKEFIPKFIELDEKIAEVAGNSSELDYIRNDIKSNIEILKASSRLRRIDKLEDKLTNAEKSYDELNKKVNIQLKNSNRINNIIKKNAKEIINLRNKYSTNHRAITELSRISLLNNKLNVNLKNGKHITLKDALAVKKRLDNFESNINNSSQSIYPTSNDQIQKQVSVLASLKNLYESEKIKNKTDEDEIKNSIDIQLRNDELIKQKRINKKNDLLEELYSIIGSNSFYFSNSFISSLESNHLSINDGKEIKDKITNEISNGSLNKSVQLRINELIKQKRNDHIKVLIKKLYSFTGEIGIKSSFYNEFSVGNLNYGELKNIKEEIIIEIKSFDLKDDGEIYSRLVELIDKKNQEKTQGLFNELNDLVGNDGLSELFITKLLDNELNEVNGNYIKRVIENRIKFGSIKNKEDINGEINKLIDVECDNQNKALEKINEIFKEDNECLEGLSNQEKQELKSRVEKSVKDNRIYDKRIYQEFKKICGEFKKTYEESNENKENKHDESKKESSGGFLSRLKRLFSR